MGSAVTITPDADPVSITPDAANPTSRNWLDSATDFAKGVWQQINPVSGVKGAAQLTAHPIQTYTADASNRQDLLDKAEKEFKGGNYSAGMAHALYGIIPFLGPQMAQAGEDIQQGNVASGLGKSTGMGLAIAGPKAIGDVMKAQIPQPVADAAGSAAERLYKSALKPSTTLSAGKVSSAIQTGLTNEIPVSAGGIEKLGNMIDDLNQSIAGEISKNPNVPINKYTVASRLGDTAQKFANQVSPTSDLDAIAKSGNDFLQTQPTNIPASAAQSLKQGTYQQLSSRAYGELGSATIEAQKSLARGLKEELANAFPELSDLNAADSKLIGLDSVLQKAVNRITNHQMLGIGTPLAAAGAKAVTGSNTAAGVTGVLKAIVDDPFVKSKLAFALNRASKGTVTIPMAAAKVQGYVDALGNAASAPNQDNQGVQ